MRKVPVAASLLILAAACSGATSSYTPPNAVPSLTLSPGSAGIAAGGEPINFHATLENDPGPIEWSLDGAGELAGSGASAVYTPPRAAREASLATIAVKAGALSAHATISIAPSARVKVTGRVIDADGGPVANVKVLVVGFDPVTTDADGRFAVEQVQAPYDLAFEDGGATVRVFAGVGRSDLLIRLARNAGNLKTATLRGTVSGGAGYPAADKTRTTVLFRPRGAMNTCAAQTDKNGKFTLTCKTIPTARASGTLHALQYSYDDSGAVAFTGYGMRPVDFDPGQSLTALDIAVASVASSPVHLTSFLPEGWVATRRGWRAQFLDGAVFGDYADAAIDGGWPEAGFDVVAPQVAGSMLMFDLTARADPAATDAYRFGISTRALTPGGAAAELIVPRPLALVAPAPAATDVAHAPLQFAWEAARGVKQLSLAIAPGGGKTVLLHSDAESGVALPDLTGLGVLILPTVEYRWSVTTVPHATLDDMFVGAPAQDADDRATVTGEPWTFTTGG